MQVTRKIEYNSEEQEALLKAAMTDEALRVFGPIKDGEKIEVEIRSWCATVRVVMAVKEEKGDE